MEVKHGAWRKVWWNFSKDREIHIESNVWSTAQTYGKSVLDLMLMLALNETIAQLANSVQWYGQVLRGEYGHVLLSVLGFDVYTYHLCLSCFKGENCIQIYFVFWFFFLNDNYCELFLDVRWWNLTGYWNEVLFSSKKMLKVIRRQLS